MSTKIVNLIYIVFKAFCQTTNFVIFCPLLLLLFLAFVAFADFV